MSLSSGFTRNVRVLPFPSGPLRTNAYLVICTETKEAAIIDPAHGSYKQISLFLEKEGLTPTKIILTHSHWDHIADASLFVQNMQLPLLVHSEDAGNVINPGSDGIPYLISIQGALPSQLLEEGQVISIGKTKWRVIHTPGHSPGSVCLFCEEAALLLSGDTLFKGSYGALHLPTSEPKRMRASLKKLAQLPPNTSVFAGHGPTTTIGQESWLDNPEHYS